MKDCFLSGAYGFIGSNLLRELIKKRDVFIYDNLSTGHVGNIQDIKAKKRNFYPVFGCYDYESALKKAKNISTIFHLGIPSSTPLYRNDRRLVGEAISDFIEVLEYCKEHKTKLVWASSSSVYNSYNPPHFEGLGPIRNTDFYTEARHFMERLCERYYDFYEVNSIGLRLFSVYGKNDWRKGKYANLITQAIIAKKKNKPFEVYGDGKQTRDFTYVKDVVRAFLLAERYKQDGNHIFNVGTGEETSINDMLDLVGVKGIDIPNPLKNYVNRTQAATNLSKTFLKFKAKYSLKDGLIDYLKTENWRSI